MIMMLIMIIIILIITVVKNKIIMAHGFRIMLLLLDRCNSYLGRRTYRAAFGQT